MRDQLVEARHPLVRRPGAHDLYPDAPALVVRCPSCTAVVLRFGRGGGRLRLDLSGTRLLTVTVPEPSAG
ncbi:DUF6510 family protein [Pseudonocardia sp. RS11V-5]|uniref:DUF6510 family protein n=1 Tax=Pseudonocardia terrae TaxID=2905831 RepID=UPI001E436F7B|nr:DUF6510 family protein [Pseudonocardia terrae]MCE3554658.1 DUF6510 family protein [Pseudonocardia terrae]